MTWRFYTFPILLAMISNAPSHAQQKTPPVHAASLAGTQVTLPDETQQKPTLLILGFTRKATEAATLWGKRTSGLGLPVYTLPVLAEVPRLLRGMVVHAIRNDVPPAVQPQFVPIFDHLEEWKKAAHFDKPDEVYVLLIDPRGTILWRAEGPVTETLIADLQAHLKPS